jgi:hypothetical protein
VVADDSDGVSSNVGVATEGVGADWSDGVGLDSVGAEAGGVNG